MMKFLQASCLGLALLFGASCAHFESNLSSAAKPDGASALLYGRLTQRHTFSAGLKIALWLENVDTRKSVFIGFDESRPFCVVRVKPGNYRIAGFLGTNRSHQIKGQESFVPVGPGAGINRPFRAEPGSQTYLGDYTAEATLDDFIEHYKMNGITNNFTATTVEFREKYVKLATVAAVSIFERR